MTIYWLLLVLPAVMAMIHPIDRSRTRAGTGRTLALAAFVIFYAGIGGLRYEVGGDWLNYVDMFEDMRLDSLAYALARSDPLYGALNWFSAQLGTEIYLVNFICSLILGLGVVQAARRLDEPWMAILIAVPYLLIVVGFGYVRQGTAIGLVLMAMASLDQMKPVRTIVFLALATGFHSSAVLVFPVFLFVFAQRHRLLAVLFAVLGPLAFAILLLPRLDILQSGYVEAEYESSGAGVRIAMSLLPALLILIRRRVFLVGSPVRSVWIMIAVGNVLLLAALVVSPSSTAVDRIALFYSVIQIAAFGEFRDVAAIASRSVLFMRLLLVGVAVAVQSVWLVFADHSEFWVPYQSIFQAQ